ncbi:MAG: helix-turn-helix domain-containing protein [Dehalococcoidia bacterium]
MSDERGPTGAPPPSWSAALRALREARGVTQDGWAAWLGVSRRTVQRWERGEVAPDAAQEAAILAAAEERGLWRTLAAGPADGPSLTPDRLRALLARARLGRGGAAGVGDRGWELGVGAGLWSHPWRLTVPPPPFAQTAFHRPRRPTRRGGVRPRQRRLPNPQPPTPNPALGAPAGAGHQLHRPARRPRRRRRSAGDGAAGHAHRGRRGRQDRLALEVARDLAPNYAEGAWLGWRRSRPPPTPIGRRRRGDARRPRRARGSRRLPRRHPRP